MNIRICVLQSVKSVSLLPCLKLSFPAFFQIKFWIFSKKNQEECAGHHKSMSKTFDPLGFQSKPPKNLQGRSVVRW